MQHPTRKQQILDYLREVHEADRSQDRTIKEIAEALNAVGYGAKVLSTAFTKPLRELYAADLLQRDLRGRHVAYRITAKGLEHIGKVWPVPPVAPSERAKILYQDPKPEDEASVTLTHEEQQALAELHGAAVDGEGLNLSHVGFDLMNAVFSLSDKGLARKQMGGEAGSIYHITNKGLEALADIESAVSVSVNGATSLIREDSLSEGQLELLGRLYMSPGYGAWVTCDGPHHADAMVLVDEELAAIEGREEGKMLLILSEAGLILAEREKKLTLIEEHQAREDERAGWPPIILEATNLLSENDRLRQRVEQLESWIREWHGDIAEVLDGCADED